MDERFLASLRQSLAQLPASPLSATVSGAHLYGFPSPDSDIDLHGAYVLPLEAVLGLEELQEQFLWDARRGTQVQGAAT